MLKDMLRKGRSTATTAGKRVTEKARTTVDRRRVPVERRPSRTAPARGDRPIEYSPRMDGDPDPGEVVWTWVPFEEDPEQGKDRPVVVIGRRGPSLVGVPLTIEAEQSRGAGLDRHR